MADLGLTDAVDAAETLLQPIWVPRQVVDHHQVGTLKVDALAGGVRRKEHLHFGVVSERLLRFQPLFTAHAAMDNDHGLCAPEQRANSVLEIRQRVPMLSKDNKF